MPGAIPTRRGLWAARGLLRITTRGVSCSSLPRHLPLQPLRRFVPMAGASLPSTSPSGTTRLLTSSSSSSKSRSDVAVEDMPHQRQQSSFLRSIDLSDPAAQKKLSKLIQEVVKTKANTGDFVPHVVVRSLCTTYRGMNINEKKQFLLILAQDLHIDTAMALQNAVQFEQNLTNVKDPRHGAVNWDHENVERYLRTFRNLRNALSPLYEVRSAATIALNSMGRGLAVLISGVGFLKLERVTYEHSPGQLLEKIIRYEAVHPVGTIVELKRRLGNVPDEPLVFVHVALMKEIASSMQSIRDETEQLVEASHAKAAIFYSISSTQKGLSGVDLGNFLIKEVAKALKTEHPHLKIFATLSPLPQFMPWLETQRNKTDESLVATSELEVLLGVLDERDAAVEADATAVAAVLDALSIANWAEDPELMDALKPIVLKLGARYIYHEKKRGKALDPVTNFHVRNGAIFERINWLADLSKKLAMGQQPTEEELFQMISEVDEDMSGAIVDAFVACGGKSDKSGFVRKETLVKIIKGDFGLTINIEEMINKLDVDGSGEIEFDEFKAILT
ncbi:hypothetical protein BBJ28_00022443 [Nothophytophthora sp. Chile5]|nr:hypothetical protein BBJ28_00022443 [Nothophytophthora sp. Chile5]